MRQAASEMMYTATAVCLCINTARIFPYVPTALTATFLARSVSTTYAPGCQPSRMDIGTGNDLPLAEVAIKDCCLLFFVLLAAFKEVSAL